MSDVFISYKAEDRRRVLALVQALQADGLTVWWDEHIGAGDEWSETIERQLNSASAVVVIWSKRSVGPEGRFVREEARRAQRRGVYIPVLIDAVEPPLGFAENQAMSLRGWRGARSDPHYQAVLDGVRRHTGEPCTPDASPEPTGVNRRAVIAGGAVAAVAAAGAGAWMLLKPASASASGSIAVLPFANLSGDPNQAYFSEGVAEEIRSVLARIAGIKVVGRTSSEAVRNDNAETAAKKLGVSSILTGSVRQSPSTIRVSAELIDGRTGLDKWSQNYDRNPGDSIKIQTDIAENVAGSLSTALGVVARAAVSVGGTQNPQAQRFYLQAKAMSGGPPKKAALEQALQLLDSALALDPNYADAYALKSNRLTSLGNGYADSTQELAQSRAESLRLAQTALRIAPNLAQAHDALAYLYSSDLQFGPAFAELKRARQLAPGDAETLATFARVTGLLGKTDEALRLLDQAIAMDPLNGYSYSMRIGTLFGARRYGEVISYAKQLQRNSPKLFVDSVTVGDALVMLGRLQEAQAYYNQEPPDYWARLTGEAMLAIRASDRAGVQAKLAKLQQASGQNASYQYGEIYAQLGDKDRAFAALDRAYEIKDAGLGRLRIDPWLDPLRSDPRFGALLRRMNFPS